MPQYAYIHVHVYDVAITQNRRVYDDCRIRIKACISLHLEWQTNVKTSLWISHRWHFDDHSFFNGVLNFMSRLHERYTPKIPEKGRVLLLIESWHSPMWITFSKNIAQYIKTVFLIDISVSTRFLVDFFEIVNRKSLHLPRFILYITESE